MKKTILIITTLMLAALACSSVGFPYLSGGTATPAEAESGLNIVLTEAAKAIQNAPTQPPNTPEPTSTSIIPPDEDASPTESAVAFTPTPVVTSTPSGFPTAIALPNPRITNFTTCLNECLSNGSNHQTSFAAKTEIIYFRFEFDEFPVSAPYSRVWYKDGKEWVRYNCYWPGPESGVEEITLTDPLGLPSGTWNVVITINGVQVANENLTVEGSWNQWSPPGYFNSCYGKR
ncbi:MAG TPA: hypothetical protein VLA32_05875 [Anaerolineales bacterium]|jgi:hypothetical protein|nr:hypothetical protein [Anaerolineales bacterium]